MGASDLFVTVTRRKLACVVDPLLALGLPQGATLTLRLAAAFEAWLPRSFWQVLDASDLLGAAAGAQPDERALAAWLALRETTDAGSWVLRWVGDNLAESQLREAGAADLIDRCEHLHETLLERLPPGSGSEWPACAHALGESPDVAALSAALDGALVLCAGTPGPPAAPPLVRLLQRAGIAVQGPALADATGLPAAERELVRQALAGAGLAPLLYRGPALAALHVLAGVGEAPWQDATAWWYWI